MIATVGITLVGLVVGIPILLICLDIWGTCRITKKVARRHEERMIRENYLVWMLQRLPEEDRKWVKAQIALTESENG